MSLYKDASLVMIPSAYKDGKLYSIRPTDGDGDFTFSRGSNLAATRVDVNGLIEKGRENLLLQSNNWAQSDSQYEITGGEAGYDGTNDAWLVNKLVTGNSYFRKDGLVYTGVMTISFYAKAGTLDRIYLFTGGEAARFDLENVTATKAGGSPIAQTIELVSGTTDWYRCFIVINKTSTENLLIKPQNSSNQDVTGTIYIQSAQLEIGLAATDYIETGASTAQAGILEDMPRLDYSGGATCPSLKLEPQRTNLIAQSEYFGAKWTLIQSVKSDGVLSPSGELTAVTITDDGLGGSSSNVRIQADNFTISASTKYTFSAYVKANPNTIIKVITRNDDALRGGTFNISTLTFTAEQGTETGNVKDFGNGFYRISTTWTSGSDTSIGIGIGFPNVTRDGTNSFTLWGAQMEEASYASSYIPTYGSAVTRNQDLCYITNLKNDVTTGATEGSVMIDFTREGYNSTGDAIQVYGDSSNGRGYVYNTGVGFASDWGFSFSSITYGNDYKILYQLNTLSTGNILKHRKCERL